MSREFSNYIKACRKAALLTQDEAAERLHISTRSLAAYEGDETPVPEDMVISMTDLYNTKALAFYYMKHQNKVGRLFLPDLKVTDLAAAVVNLKKEINDIQAMEKRLFEIVCDGQISEDEKTDWEAMQKELSESAAAALVLSFL